MCANFCLNWLSPSTSPIQLQIGNVKWATCISLGLGFFNLLDESDEGAISSYLWKTKENVRLWVCDLDSGRTLGSILTKTCTHAVWSKISVEFDNGKNAWTVSKLRPCLILKERFALNALLFWKKPITPHEKLHNFDIFFTFLCLCVSGHFEISNERLVMNGSIFFWKAITSNEIW